MDDKLLMLIQQQNELIAGHTGNMAGVIRQMRAQQIVLIAAIGEALAKMPLDESKQVRRSILSRCEEMISGFPEEDGREIIRRDCETVLGAAASLRETAPDPRSDD